MESFIVADEKVWLPFYEFVFTYEGVSWSQIRLDPHLPLDLEEVSLLERRIKVQDWTQNQLNLIQVLKWAFSYSILLDDYFYVECSLSCKILDAKMIRHYFVCNDDVKSICLWVNGNPFLVDVNLLNNELFQLSNLESQVSH